MGATLSVLLYPPIYRDVPGLKKWEKFFKSLSLEEVDIGRLFRVFRRIDAKKTGSIAIVDMLIFLDCESTPFTERVLTMFDPDKSGFIDFKEFIVTVWNYCTLETKSSIALFAFDLYDKDGGKELDAKELSLILKDVYGHNYSTNSNALRTMTSIQELYSRNEGTIGISLFEEFCRTHPSLLYPAYIMQRRIRHKVIGKYFWDMMTKRRSTLLEEKNISRRNLLAMQQMNIDLAEMPPPSTNAVPTHIAGKTPGAVSAKPSPIKTTQEAAESASPSRFQTPTHAHAHTPHTRHRSDERRDRDRDQGADSSPEKERERKNSDPASTPLGRGHERRKGESRGHSDGEHERKNSDPSNSSGVDKPHDTVKNLLRKQPPGGQSPGGLLDDDVKKELFGHDDVLAMEHHHIAVPSSSSHETALIGGGHAHNIAFTRQTLPKISPPKSKPKKPTRQGAGQTSVMKYVQSHGVYKRTLVGVSADID